MKIAVIFLHPFSESMGSFVRVAELATSLASFGNEIYIFTPYERSHDLSNKIHVISFNDFINKIKLSTVLYGLSKKLYYSSTFPTIFTNNLQEDSEFFKILVKIMASIIRQKQIELIQIEQDIALPLGIALKKETELPLIVDLHNISSEELVSSGKIVRLSNGFKQLQIRTSNYIKRMDHVLVVSDDMKNYVIENYNINSSKLTVIPPGGRTINNKSIINLRKEPFKITYAGLVSYRERVDLFIKCMPFVLHKKSNVIFYITKKGDDLHNIKKLASKLMVSPNYFWFDNYRVANNFLSLCHVGILTSSNDIARRLGTPAKLFNYMALGLPIVANDIGGWTEIIKKEQVGVLTSSNPEDFGNSLLNLLDNPRLMQEFALNGLCLINKKYNWDNSAVTLTNVYKEL